MKSNIKGFPNYHISEDGQLFRKNNNGIWVKMASNIKNTGYISNILWNGDIKTNKYRHRLVAEVYIPNPDNKPFVCHKDNNRVNNCIDNLYWGTPKENMHQAVIDGSYHIEWDKRGRIMVDEIGICRMYSSGITRKVILSKYKISIGKYYEILHKYGILWKQR